jgi:hypothetical protein
LVFLAILQEACIQSLNKYNIRRSWEKTGLFPFDPEVVIRLLSTVILQQEKEVLLSKPLSRPTTSGQPALLDIKTPTDINSVKLVINISFKTIIDNIKSMLGLVDLSQYQHLKDLEVIVWKLGNSATSAISETVLIQGVNKELIESADYQKNCKKASKKEKDKISDTRVLSLAMMDKAIRIKAEKKKEAEEKLVKEKRLKAQQKQ